MSLKVMILVMFCETLGSAQSPLDRGSRPNKASHARVSLIPAVASPLPQNNPRADGKINMMVHQAGLRILDPAGRPIKLHGVNLAGWLQWEGFLFGKGIFVSYSKVINKLDLLIGPEETARFRDEIFRSFITEADIRKISQLGFNSVRIPINRHALEAPTGWNVLDDALSWCEKYHVYVILDLHAVPGGQSRLPTSDPDGGELVWHSDENQRRTVALWKQIATRYRSRPIVAAYDLVNEPAPPTGPELVTLYDRIIRAIREVDPHHMVFLEGGKLASEFSMFDRPICDNMAYSFHMYTWFGDNRERLLHSYRAIADQQQVPFWCGEFGENTYEMTDSTVRMFDAGREIAGWCYFPWKRAPTKYPGLVTINVPEDWRKVMNWITAPLFNRPMRGRALSGAREFVRAVRLEDTSLDQKMVTVLTGNKDKSE
jgi:endoglucanase